MLANLKLYVSIKSEIEEIKSDDFILDININDLSKLTELLMPELAVSANTHFTCNFDSDDDMLKLYANSDWIEYNNMRFANIQLDTSSKLKDIDTSYVFNIKRFLYISPTNLSRSIGDGKSNAQKRPKPLEFVINAGNSSSS